MSQSTSLSAKHILFDLYKDRVLQIHSSKDLPGKSSQLVYILTHNDKAIVVGQGKKNRAKVIFDDVEQSSSHYKSLYIRIHHLYESKTTVFERFMIECVDRNEALQIEKELHQKIGGKGTHLPLELKNQLFEGISPDAFVHKFLRIALCSSFCGINDLWKWRKENIIDDESWKIIQQKLRLKKKGID